MTAFLTPTQDQADGLQDLTNLVRDCATSGVGRRVLLLRSDLLPPRLSLPHHLRLAHEALEPLAGADRARRHELPQGRLAISWRGEAAHRINEVLENLESLLTDSPLEAPSMPELARLFELPKDGTTLMAHATCPPHTTPNRLEPEVEAFATAPKLPTPLDLETLGAIEDRLAAANVARFVRRRTVFRQGGAGLAVAWETRFVSINELTLELCPGRNPYAEPWLFRRLTRVLDRRMLSLLSQAAELRDAGAFSLNLNVGGVLSPEFLRFDAALPARLRGHTVLDLHPADIMGDVATFRFACAFARARGHRILLRAVTPPLLGLLDLAALELDFVELRWSPTLVGLDPSALRAGTARWLLARADDESALRWGRAAGIGLFQGDAIHPGLPTPTPRALMRA